MDKSRIKKLQADLRNPVLIKKKENLLYLTGRSFMHGYLLVIPSAKREGLRAKTVFFGDGLEHVEGIKSDRLKNIGLYLGRAEKLELEDEFSFREYNYIRKKVKGIRYKVKINHVKSPVDYQRQIKEPGEIRLVGKSMNIVGKVFDQVRREIKKPGMTEFRLTNFIKSAGLKLGAEDVSFPPIVACGANAAVPHHVPSNKKLKPGESIIIDFGFKYKNYCSDFTRTVFLKKVSPRLEEAYNQVEKAYNSCMPLRASASERSNLISGKGLLRRPARGGAPRNDSIVTGNDLYQRAVDVLAEKHLDKYFIHSLGHGTGLEIHELPNLSPGSKDILQNGMVFSIEPGVYIPKLGGIRIEDLVYLDKGECKKFIEASTKLAENIL